MKLYFFIIFLMITSNMMAQIAPYRKLLIFPDQERTFGQHQLNLLEKSAAGVMERDLTVIVADNEKRLYAKYKIDTGQFTVLLIGKDGYEKYRTNKILKMNKLFSIIDAMPMRKVEMIKKANQ